MKTALRIATVAVLGLGLLSAGAPDAEARNRNTGKILGGIAAGVAGAIILNEVAKSRHRDERHHYYYERKPRISCRELDDRCYHGQGWACRKFDRQCH